MKFNKGFTGGLILTLAGTLLWAGLSWGQGQGPGGPQGAGPGQCVGGVCRVPAPETPGCPANPNAVPGSGLQKRGKMGKGPGAQAGPGKNMPNPPASPPSTAK